MPLAIGFAARGLGFAASVGALVALSGCAREPLLPAPVVPAPALVAVPPPWASASHLPTRIPPPVAPYVYPDPTIPLPRLELPQWAAGAGAPYAAAVQRAASYYQLPPELIWAVIKVESNFRDRAISPAGAQGLMQLMPSTADSIGLRDALDPEQNILGGAYYLRHLANRFAGDLVLTLAGYNAGPGAVQRHGGLPPYPETQNYVRRVLGYYWTSVSISLSEASKPARPAGG
jgi:soluble lytic murein transglycosylase-like protein